MISTELDYKPFLEEGEKYCSTAVNALAKGKFTPDLLHGITIMSAEKLLMAYLLSKGILASGHTLDGLYSEIPEKEKFLAVKPGLDFIQSFQSICSMDSFELKTPTTEEMKTMTKTIAELKKLVIKEIQSS